MAHRTHRTPLVLFFLSALLAILLLPVPVGLGEASGSELAAPSGPSPDSDPWPRRVLITNDNGIDDVATQELARAFARNAEVVLVAPAVDRSGSGSFMTFPKTGRFLVERREVGEGVAAWALDGYPADCVAFALAGPMAEAPPDLVISGINGGANLADEWFGSGTVGAARTAAFLGVPALAVSGVEDDEPEAVAAVVDWVLRLVRGPVMDQVEPPGYLTVSLPVGSPSEIEGVEVVDRARGILGASAELAETADGKQVWSIALEARERPEPETDAAAVARGRIAVVPMRVGDEAPEMLHWLREKAELLPAWQPVEGDRGDRPSSDP